MKYVIYGASNMGQTAFQVINLLHKNVEYFIDSNEKKQGTFFCGKKIISPNEIKNINGEFLIIIGSMFVKEIKTTLIESGISQKNVTTLAEFVVKNIKKINIKLNSIYNEESCVIFDCLLGLELGGLQNWTFFVGDELKKRGENVKIITSYDKEGYGNAPEALYDSIRKVNDKSILEIAQFISENLPCTIFTRHVEPVYIAAQIVKQQFPNEIKIISEIHTGATYVSKVNGIIQNTINGILVVSQDIKDVMINQYKCIPDRVFYKESPVEYNENLVRCYSKNYEPIKIGYAARIESYPKRADLLPILVDELEKLKIDYQLIIAGNGSYFDKLKNEIDNRNLNGKVKLIGFINHDKVAELYSKSDICINVSDYEGSSLSILEAMACGAVPIETDVSGAREFIQNDENGYICDVGDMEMMAKYIEKLYNDREKIKKFGAVCRKIVKDKCNKQDYIDYLLKMIKSL